MNKKTTLLIIGILILIIGSLVYLFFTQKSSESTNETINSSETKTTPTSETSHSAPNTQTGSYVDYSADALANTSGTKLIFFYAPWCPQCRAMDESIKTGGVPDGVTVFKTDYDSNQSLRAKYGVTIQTTFVKVDDNGNKVASYVAYEKPVFSKVKQELLR